MWAILCGRTELGRPLRDVPTSPLPSVKLSFWCFPRCRQLRRAHSRGQQCVPLHLCAVSERQAWLGSLWEDPPCVAAGEMGKRGHKAWNPLRLRCPTGASPWVPQHWQRNRVHPPSPQVRMQRAKGTSQSCICLTVPGPFLGCSRRCSWWDFQAGGSIISLTDKPQPVGVGPTGNWTRRPAQ